MSKLKYYDGTNWKIVNGQVTGDTLPIGAIVPFGGWDAPTGWLICDGTLLNKTAYPELFNAIGYSFGGEEGGSTFGLPDLRGKVPVGIDENDSDFDGMGVTGGEKTHTLTVAEMPSHSHDNTFLAKWGGQTQASHEYYNVDTATGTEYGNRSWLNYNGSTGGGQAHNIMNPYQTVNYIIKATQSAGLVANVSNIQSDSTTDTYSCDYLNGEVIYDNSNGTSTDFTLDSTINNYRYVEVYYRTNDANSMSCKKAQVQYNATTLMSLDFCYILSNALYYKCANISINGTTATFTGNSQVLLNGSLSPSAGNYVFVFKIIGYK